MLDRSKVNRCKSCRWWERSNNFRSADRDWGLCHFWGRTEGARFFKGFIDYTVGHEPRGGMTCGHHNADPATRGQDGLTPPAIICCAGDPQ